MIATPERSQLDAAFIKRFAYLHRELRQRAHGAVPDCDPLQIAAACLARGLQPDELAQARLQIVIDRAVGAGPAHEIDYNGPMLWDSVRPAVEIAEKLTGSDPIILHFAGGEGGTSECARRYARALKGNGRKLVTVLHRDCYSADNNLVLASDYVIAARPEISLHYHGCRRRDDWENYKRPDDAPVENNTDLADYWQAVETGRFAGNPYDWFDHNFCQLFIAKAVARLGEHLRAFLECLSKKLVQPDFVTFSSSAALANGMLDRIVQI